MRSLEKIVSKAFDSLGRLENKAVNSAFASKLAIKKPLAAGLIGGVGTLGAAAYLNGIVISQGRSLQADVYTIAAPVAAVGAGWLLYDLASKNKEVSDAGLPVNEFYEISDKVDDAEKGFWRLAFRSPRKTALVLSVGGLAALNYFAAHSGFPLDVLAKMDLVAAPALYLAARGFMNSFRPLSSAVSFKAALAEMFTFLMAKATGYKKPHIKVLESIARSMPSAHTSMELAEAYFDVGRFDEAILQVKDVIERRGEVPASYTPALGIKRLSAAADSHKAIRTGKATHGDHIIYSRICQAIGENPEAEKTIKSMTRKFPGIESKILAAMFLENNGNKDEAASYWKRAASSVFLNEQLQVLPVSEKGVHNVRRYGPTPIIAGTFVFKEAESRSHYNFEKGMISKVRSLLQNSHYSVPQVVAAFASKNGSTKYNLVLRYIEGKSPSELQKEGKLGLNELSSIADYLAWIHRNVETGQKRLNLDLKLRQILKNPYLALREDLADNIKANMSFIIEEQKSAPYVFAKDPHPAQWRFGKDKLTALDWDSTAVTPLFIDAAKFYVHPDISIEDWLLYDAHGEAARLYKDNKLFSNDSEFRINLLDAMLFQTLSFVSAWSKPEMRHMRQKRTEILELSPQIFRIIESEHQSHYRNHALSYEGIRHNFIELWEMLQPAAAF